MAAHSYGLVPWRRAAEGIEVLVAHMGGPYWARKDAGAWTFPKGLPEPGEEPLATARREYAEELGLPAPDAGFVALGEVRQSGGKRVTAWAVEVDVEEAQVAPGEFEMEWPPRSGRTCSFPEVDRVAWVSPERARELLVTGQRDCSTYSWSSSVTQHPDLLAQLGGPVTEVAPRLLGARLSHAGVTVRITEVEAYAGADDPGSHSYRGRTARNSTMFGPPAHIYTYFTYGMHWCANAVTGPEGDPSAVLLRAGEVVEGLETARARRPGRSDRELARGPASLCRALALGREHDGLDLTGLLELAPRSPDAAVRTGPRVGLRLAADRPWRFWLSDEPTVSRYVAAKPRR